MADRPILFSAPMIRALIEGRKNQTRRKLDAWCEYPPAIVERGVVTAFDENEEPYRWPRTHAVGERLWVRESHAIVPRTAYRMSEGVQQTLRPNDDHDACVYAAGWERSRPGQWRPSIHMPRWASRITLIVTDVRVQRLQDISEEDAIAEGIEWRDGCWATYDTDGSMRCGGSPDPVEAYRCLWVNINGRGTWDANPWIVAYSFRTILKNIDEVA